MSTASTPLSGALTEKKPLAVSDQGRGRYIKRFGPVERTTHALVMFSFFGLVITGVPLRFSAAPWAAPLMRLQGGPVAAATMHRICAVITFGYFALHLWMVFQNWLKAPHKLRFFIGPRSMVPQMKDVHDVVGQFKWFLGFGPRPRFDRFSYMEKFDYLAVFWGVMIIGGSGLLLWFPIFFSKFLPGWMFNIATIIHGDEALLALGFIFTIHFFNVHFRPEKFPIDLIIFTGRARAEYFEEEHPLEYERGLRDGTLEFVDAPTRFAYMWSMFFGFLSMALGVVLVGLVIYAVFIS
jgi:cytochrome b subunit of formate dehydrogenase